MPVLKRELGLATATLITVGSMVGSGIFFVPNLVAREFPDARVIVAVWVLGGLFALAGALSVAELAAMYPRSGGPYRFVREAFGEGAAFFFGWSYFLLAKAAIGAAVAYVFAVHVSYFFALTPRGVTLIAAWALACLAFINYLGVRLTGQVNNVLTFLKTGALVFIVFAAFLMAPDAVPAAPAVAAVVAGGSLSAAFVAVLFAYNAWINATFVAEEVRNPERTLPRALALGVGIVLVLYVAANLAYIHLLGAEGVAASSLVATDAASRLVSFGGTFVAAAVLVSTFGNLNGGTLTGARLPFAMAQDGLLPHSVASVSRFATPGIALAVQLGASLAILASGSFQRIITFAIVVIWAGLLVVGLSVFRLRRLRPALARPYRVVGYPVTPALFVLAAGFVVAQTVLEQPREAIYGLVIAATGIPVYAWMRWRSRVSSRSAEALGSRR